MTKHDVTIERLKHWLDLADGDRAIGDDAGISAKLLVIRAEIESALNLRRKPAPAADELRASIFKLQFKYATATLLFVAAVVVSIWVAFSNGGGRQMTATVAESPKTVLGNEGSEDSRGTSIANLPDASYDSSDEADLVTDVRSPGGSLGSGSGRRNTAGGRAGAESSLASAAGDESGVAASTAALDSAASSPQESSATAVMPGDGGAADSSEAPAAAHPFQPATERPKLDPLSLIAALDAHFESVE